MKKETFESAIDRAHKDGQRLTQPDAEHFDWAKEQVGDKAEPITVSIESREISTSSTGLSRRDAWELLAYYHRKGLHKGSTIKVYGKQKITRNGDQEPTCPSCGTDNAMLRDRDQFNPEVTPRDGLKCRDCGHTVDPGTYYIVDEFEDEIKKAQDELAAEFPDIVDPEFYCKCDNGFVATIRMGNFSQEEWMRMHEENGLSSPQFAGGDSYMFQRFIQVNMKHFETGVLRSKGQTMSHTRQNGVEDIYHCSKCNKYTRVPRGHGKPDCENGCQPAPPLFFKVVETDTAFEMHISMDEEAVRLHEAPDCSFPKSGQFTSHLLEVSRDHLVAKGAREIKATESA